MYFLFRKYVAPTVIFYFSQNVSVTPGTQEIAFPDLAYYFLVFSELYWVFKAMDDGGLKN